MHGLQRVLLLCTILALPTSAWAKDGGKSDRGSCPADVDAAVAAQCPCDSQRNHGQYVGCVARYGNTLRKAGCRMGTALRMIRCAALSTCGRPGAVVCCASSAGTCNDPAPGDGTAAGSCSNKPWIACDTDDDCTRTRMRITRDAATCTAGGGVSGGAGSMCSACAGLPTTGAPTTTTTTSSTTSSTVVVAPVTTTSSSTTTTSTSTTTSTTTLPPGVTYGNAGEFPAASWNSPGYLLGGPLTVSQTSTLTHLGLVAKAAGPHVIVALYSDTAGEPDRLVASTPATTLTVGPVEVPVTRTPLPAGTYWIMAMYDGDASVGIDESDPDAPVRYMEQSFSDPLPDPMPPAFSYSGQRFNYYVRVAE